jgi:uncharacterized protein YbaP (TraB family)
MPLILALLLVASTALGTNNPTFVWNIGGGTAPMAVCGSVHMLPPDAHPLPPAFQQAYEQSEIIVFELLMDELFQPQSLKTLQEAMIRPPSSGSDISPELRARLHSELQARGLPPTVFDAFQPWAIVQQLALLELQKYGISPAYGVDLHFYNLAKRDQKERIGLETLDQHIGFLQAMDTSGDERLLADSLDQLPQAKANFDRLLAAWRTGDRDGLATLMNEFFKSGIDLDETLLRARNRAWIPKLVELLQGTRPVMVIVGAAHLCGPENVLELLEARGYTISRP